MKIALISDSHYGARNDSISLLQHQNDFCKGTFFPTLMYEGIRTVIHLGDLVDRRKYINYNTMACLRNDFLRPLNEIANTIILAGNHDAFNKNNLEINALQMAREFENIDIIEHPTEVDLDTPILLLPWICDENRQHSYDMINTTPADICMGHLEIAGFEFHSGVVCEHGMDSANLSKFDMVFSGHFHKKQTAGNIHYLGATHEMTWNDYDCPRGFHVFDTETRILRYIKNPKHNFIKLVYDDTGKTYDDFMGANFEAYRNSYVKIIVVKKTNAHWLNLWVEEISKYALDVKTDEHTAINSKIDMSIGKIDDTTDILKRVIEDTDVTIDKTQLERKMLEIYNLSLQREM